MKRSKLLIAVGLYLALAGFSYFFSPSQNAYGEREITPFTTLISAWLFACGLGLALHKKWSAWLYLVGTVVFSLYAVSTVVQTGGALSAAIGKGVFALILLGLPLIAVWFRRKLLGFGIANSADA